MLLCNTLRIRSFCMLTVYTEGSWEDVTKVIGQAHSLLHEKGVVRIQSDIRIGSRYAGHAAAVLGWINKLIYPGRTKCNHLKTKSMRWKSCWQQIRNRNFIACHIQSIVITTLFPNYTVSGVASDRYGLEERAFAFSLLKHMVCTAREKVGLQHGLPPSLVGQIFDLLRINHTSARILCNCFHDRFRYYICLERFLDSCSK